MSPSRTPSTTSSPRPRRKSSAAPRRRVLPAAESPSPSAAPVSSLGLSLSLYRRIAAVFMCLSLAALGVVAAVSTMSAKIEVTLKPTAVENSFLIDVRERPVGIASVAGSLEEKTVSVSRSFAAQGKEQESRPGRAEGEVMLINTTARNQPLVATTRVRSPDGRIFRLLQGTMIPARGRVTARVRADESGASGDIAPTRFTIPGLPSSLQETIYAESTTPFTGGLLSVSVLSEEEQMAARLQVEEEAVVEARSTWAALHTGQASTLDVETLSQEITPEAGSEAASFTVVLELRIREVFYEASAVQALAEAGLLEEVPVGFELLPGWHASFALETFRPELRSATVRVTSRGVIVPSAAHRAFDVTRFVSKTQEEIQAQLLEDDVAESVSTRFFPPWLQKTPALKDRIRFELLPPVSESSP